MSDFLMWLRSFSVLVFLRDLNDTNVSYNVMILNNFIEQIGSTFDSDNDAIIPIVLER